MSLEFDLIEKYFTPLSQGGKALAVGIGDDGAVLNVPEQHQLVVVTDTLVAGVHFPLETSAYDIGWKALAVNLSDLAAMGATPSCYSLALTLPEHDADWLSAFSQGLRDLSHQFNESFQIPLIGGDTTKGPLTITITAQGWVPNQQAILRSGAQMGDLICVTNTLGEGALGLQFALNLLPDTFLKNPFSEPEKTRALNALNCPMPQLALCEEMRGLVNSAIDISDGLLADLGHILKCSSSKAGEPLGAKIELSKLPLSSGVSRYILATNHWALPLSGGDDYQLCLTLSKENLATLLPLAEQKGVQLSVIGEVVNQAGIRCLKEGKLWVDKEESSGYHHF